MTDTSDFKKIDQMVKAINWCSKHYSKIVTCCIFVLVFSLEATFLERYFDRADAFIISSLISFIIGCAALLLFSTKTIPDPEDSGFNQE